MNEFNKSEIGMNAGRVWNALSRKSTEISIQELCYQLRMSFEEAVLAIGWLAKEDNIGINKKDGRLMLVSKCKEFSFG